MRVRFLVFNLSVIGDGPKFADYAMHIAENSHQTYRLGEFDRYLYFNSDCSPKYHVGLLITVKDNKKLCVLERTDQRHRVIVRGLAANSNLIHFNFFAINKRTGTGVYQYYHHSCSLGQFAHLNRKQFAIFRDSIEGSEVTPKKYRQRAYLAWEALVRPEDLSSLVKELKSVRAFQYSFATLRADEDEFRSLGPHVKKQVTRIAFFQGSPVEAIGAAVGRFVRRTGVESGKIEGLDEDGIERVLRIVNNPNCLREFEFDDVVDRINTLDVTTFHTTWVVRELLKECESRSEIFESEWKT
jgi:hypothetical protein